MVKLGTYAAASTLGAVAVVFHAFQSRGQFYPAMIYLATSKISLVLLSNMAFVLMCTVWQLVKVIFLGTLREAEVERLNEQSWRELMELLFAMTIFREEFNVPFLAMVTVLLFIKAFHWLAQKRVEYIETTPSVSRLSHFRMIFFLGFLLLVDSVFLHKSVVVLLQTKRASVSLLFAFEYMILATTTVAIFLKYVFYVCDVVLEGQWENKAVFTFYLELVRDLLHLSLYLCFFFVIFINYGLPLHLVRELYDTFRNFKARVADFIRYRKITSNMNDRFPDATMEELSRSDATCIICREEMVAAKKLPCGHLFHVHCLRSWLERQQTCPTCRSPILAPEGPQAAAAGEQAGVPIQLQQLHQPPLVAQIPQMMQGQNGSPNACQVNMPNLAHAQGAQSSGGFLNAAETHLQAAMAAASHYNSSFVYPAVSGNESIRYPSYMYYIPRAYLEGLPSSQNWNAVGASGTSSDTNPSTSNIPSQFPFVIPCTVVLGVLHPSGFTQGVLGSRVNEDTHNSLSSSQLGTDRTPRENDSQQSSAASSDAFRQGLLELQRRQLQESIMVLEHQRNMIVDLQNQLNSSASASMTVSPVADDTKGKASMKAEVKCEAPAEVDPKGKRVTHQGAES